MDRTVDKDHGRLGTRECWTIADPTVLRGLRGIQEWDQLRSVVKIRAKRVFGDTETVDDRVWAETIRDHR